MRFNRSVGMIVITPTIRILKITLGIGILQMMLATKLDCQRPCVIRYQKYPLFDHIQSPSNVCISYQGGHLQPHGFRYGIIEILKQA